MNKFCYEILKMKITQGAEASNAPGKSQRDAELGKNAVGMALCFTYISK